MSFFQNIPWYSAVMWFVVLFALIGLNELIRRSKWASIGIFLMLPVILTVFWMLFPDPEIRNWFYWVKVYSAIAGSVIFMVIRFTDFHKKHKWYLVLPPAILGLNIAEAVAREFEIGFSNIGVSVGGVNGLAAFNMPLISGDWNIANAIAGILNIVLLCGWFGIASSRKPGDNPTAAKDMLWPDQINLWVIAYGIWNISYVYSCSTFNAFYSGFALNIAATIPALFWARGAWLQHRAATLSFWMMWVMTFPRFFYNSPEAATFQVNPSFDPWANRTIAYLSLTLNVALAIWQVYRIVKLKKNPLKDEIYIDLKQYQEIAAKRA